MIQTCASRTCYAEAIPRGAGDGSLVQLTSTPLISDLLRPADAFTPDGRRVLFTRRHAPHLPRELWLADLTTCALSPVCTDPHAVAPALSPDGRCLYYLRNCPPLQLQRVWLETGESETVLTTDLEGPALDCGTVRADGGAYAATVQVAEKSWALLRFELGSGHAHLIGQGPELYSARPQYEPSAGRRLLVAESHTEPPLCSGVTPPLPLNLIPRVVDDTGAWHLPVALGGTDLELLVTDPCWAGATGRVVGALMCRVAADQAFKPDRLVATTPGQEDRQTVGYGHRFAHPSTSRDGRWWACDEAQTGDVYVGSLWTGRAALLVRTGASWGTPTYTQPRPLMSPDGTRVVYVSDVTGVPQLYVARISEELRAKLEE
jgi:Tol biopolymer transport system component